MIRTTLFVEKFQHHPIGEDGLVVASGKEDVKRIQIDGEILVPPLDFAVPSARNILFLDGSKGGYPDFRIGISEAPGTFRTLFHDSFNPVSTRHSFPLTHPEAAVLVSNNGIAIMVVARKTEDQE